MPHCAFHRIAAHPKAETAQQCNQMRNATLQHRAFDAHARAARAPFLRRTHGVHARAQARAKACASH
eukprot:3332644-Lingulodinium_polyedra.AAC.1